jgi:phosphate/phosphite/phosphonate ABC transporter binding protein
MASLEGNTRTRWLIVGATALFLVALGVGVLLRYRHDPPRPQGPPLRFGLPPSFTVSKALSELQPLFTYLEQQVGRRIRVVVDRDYDTLRRQLGQGKVELALLPHLQVVLAHYEPVQPQMVAVLSYKGRTTYRAVLVRRDNSPIRTPEDLRGKRFCWSDPGSASGYLVPRHFLRNQGLDPDQIFASVRFSGSHLAALTDVVEGHCDAAATNEGWLQLAPKKGLASSRLRVLADAGSIPLDVLCASPRLPPALLEGLRRALLEFRPARHAGREVLGPSFLADGFALPRLQDFETIEHAAREEGILPQRLP